MRLVSNFLLVAAGVLSASAICFAADPLTPPVVPEGAILGYINTLPKESAKEKAERHKVIAEKKKQDVIVLVHRGANKMFPENTLEAYNAALNNGADGLEIDIHFAKDGVVYMMHDEKLDRTTSCSGNGKDKTYYELLQCDIKGAPNKNCRVPTFISVLELARQRRALLHIDVKDKEMGPVVSKILKEADMADHIVWVNGQGDAGGIIEGLNTSFLKHKGGFDSNNDRENPNMDDLNGILKNEGQMIQCEDPRWTIKGLGRKKTNVPLSPSLRVYWTKDGVLATPPQAK